MTSQLTTPPRKKRSNRVALATGAGIGVAATLGALYLGTDAWRAAGVGASVAVLATLALVDDVVTDLGGTLWGLAFPAAAFLTYMAARRRFAGDGASVAIGAGTSCVSLTCAISVMGMMATAFGEGSR